MLHPDYFDLCIEVVEEIVKKASNVSIALQPLLKDFEDELYHYTKEQTEIIDKQYELYGSKIKWTADRPIFRGSMKAIGNHETVDLSAHRFISNNSNHWKDWSCYAGVEQLVVDTEGKVWRGWCKEGGIVGVIEEHIDFPTEPIICKKDYCHCNFDIMCTKEKI